ncbi:MAG: hypothetical protein HRU11_13980 [Parvularculaceae bacterium]|nr:hypothetical protein [Parvularculaceae bacterium]
MTDRLRARVVLEEEWPGGDVEVHTRPAGWLDTDAPGTVAVWAQASNIEMANLTPTQARRMAAALIEAADEVEDR